MPSAEGVVSIPSPYPVSETLHRLTAILQDHGMKIFARIDHSGEAEKAGLEMPATQVLIFGNPKGGTGIMLAAPLSAIDLPLKALAWTDAQGKVFLSYNDPEYLRKRFGLTDEAIKPIAGIGALIGRTVS